MKLTKVFTIERPGRKPEEQRWGWVEDMHCPGCGKTEVWHEDDPGDYYVGETHLCVECGYAFTIQPAIARDGALEKLRS
jgi:hypothetical protein